MDGLEVCSILKNDERTSHIPVIMCTAKTTLEEKIEGLKSGADEYIFKPFDIKELKVRISNLIVSREKLRMKYGMLTGLEFTDKLSMSMDDNFMARVATIITENIRDFDFDVGALQEKTGMSRVHLYRKIKAITGLSPSALIRNFRMKNAAELIKMKSMSLTKIALNVGFTNPSYFSKCFRDYYGVSPKEYSDNNNLKR
jgi:AraC-like DNA-binding protein